VLGALLLLAVERRLPQPARQATRLALRRTAQAAMIVAVALAALAMAGAVAAVELLVELVRALG
jgi:hypothetical protein